MCLKLNIALLNDKKKWHRTFKSLTDDSIFFFKFYIIFSEKCINDSKVLQIRPHARIAEPSIENKSRRRRTAFTSSQLLELEREFQAKRYLSLTERSEIANALKLSEVQVILTLSHCIF